MSDNTKKWLAESIELTAKQLKMYIEGKGNPSRMLEYLAVLEKLHELRSWEYPLELKVTCGDCDSLLVAEDILKNTTEHTIRVFRCPTCRDRAF